MLFLNLVVKPVYIFGIDVTVQNNVGSDYGFYFYIFNFSFLFNIILDLGITQFNSRNIAQHSHLLNKYFSGIVMVKLMLGVIYFLITFLAALIIGYGSEKLYFLAFLAFNQFLLMFIQYLRSNISGLLLFKTDSILSVLDRLLMILICGALLWGGITNQPFQIEWFIYAQTASYLLTTLVALSIVIKKARFTKLNWNWLFILSIIKQLYPFSILVFLMTITNRVDTVIIEQLLPAQNSDVQVSIYAHGYRVLDAFNNYALLFSVLLLPLFARMIKLKENILHLARLAFSLLFTASVIISVSSFFYSYEIMALLYDQNIEESAAFFRIIMFAFIPISTTYVFGTLLTAHGSLKKLNLIYMVAVGISFAINLSLVPVLMAKGSAWANLSTQFFAAVLQVALAARMFGFRLNLRYLFCLLAFVALVIVYNLLSEQLAFSWGVRFLLVLGISFITALALRLLNLKEIIRIIKEKP